MTLEPSRQQLALHCIPGVFVDQTTAVLLELTDGLHHPDGFVLYAAPSVDEAELDKLLESAAQVYLMKGL